MQRVADARLDIEALDMVVAALPSPVYTLWIRLGGWETVLPARLAQLRQVLGGGEEVTGQTEAAFWCGVREFAWAPAESTLVKVATTAAQLPALDQHLAATPALRHYAVAGNLAWVAWPGKSADLHEWLTRLGLAAVILRGKAEQPWIGRRTGQGLARRIKQALDPANKFLPL
jgi:hypothetical protein